MVVEGLSTRVGLSAVPGMPAEPNSAGVCKRYEHLMQMGRVSKTVPEARWELLSALTFPAPFFYLFAY